MKVFFASLLLVSIFCIQAQDLAITSGYSSSERSFLLDLGSGSLSPAGDQDWEPNLTFMAVSQDGKAIYTSHEVTEYGSFGQTGAVSRWLKGRDPMGKPIFGKFEVNLNLYRVFQQVLDNFLTSLGGYFWTIF